MSNYESLFLKKESYISDLVVNFKQLLDVIKQYNQQRRSLQFSYQSEESDKNWEKTLFMYFVISNPNHFIQELNRNLNLIELYLLVLQFKKETDQNTDEKHTDTLVSYAFQLLIHICKNNRTNQNYLT